MTNNEAIRADRTKVADILGVSHNADGTEFYGMDPFSVAWMCVFHKHGTCVATECLCTCHYETEGVSCNHEDIQ